MGSNGPCWAQNRNHMICKVRRETSKTMKHPPLQTKLISGLTMCSTNNIRMTLIKQLSIFQSGAKLWFQFVSGLPRWPNSNWGVLHTSNDPPTPCFFCCPNSFSPVYSKYQLTLCGQPTQRRCLENKQHVGAGLLCTNGRPCGHMEPLSPISPLLHLSIPLAVGIPNPLCR